MQIIDYDTRHFDGVDTLWRSCFPDDPVRNLAANSIPAKLALNDSLLLVAESSSEAVIGTIMAGYDGHRGWLYSVAVAPDYRRKRVGQALVTEACQRLRKIGCAKVNLQIRSDNDDVQAFYSRLGFTVEQRISMGREL